MQTCPLLHSDEVVQASVRELFATQTPMTVGTLPEASTTIEAHFCELSHPELCASGLQRASQLDAVALLGMQTPSRSHGVVAEQESPSAAEPATEGWQAPFGSPAVEPATMPQTSPSLQEVCE